MEKIFKPNPGSWRSFEAVVFLKLSTSVVTAYSITPHLSLFQEKLLYITISLVFFFVMQHTICSRVSYVFAKNRRGRWKKE